MYSNTPQKKWLKLLNVAITSRNKVLNCKKWIARLRILHCCDNQRHSWTSHAKSQTVPASVLTSHCGHVMVENGNRGISTCTNLFVPKEVNDLVDHLACFVNLRFDKWKKASPCLQKDDDCPVTCQQVLQVSLSMHSFAASFLSDVLENED